VKIILVIQCEAQDQLILLGAIIVGTTEVIQGISVGVKGIANGRNMIWELTNS
jgi:hypothetical protein